MVEVPRLKRRLLLQLHHERRHLDYFPAAQQRSIIEMMADGWIKARKHDHHTLYITTAGHNVLKKIKGAP